MVARQLFITSAFFFLLCTSGHIVTPDGVLMFRLTQSLIDRGTLAIDDLEIAPGSGTTARVSGPDGIERQFAKYGLGLPLAAVPAYFAGRALLPLITSEQRALFDIPEDEILRREAFAATGSIPERAEDFRWLYYDPKAEAGAEGFLAFCAGLTNSLVAAVVVTGVFLTCRQMQHSLRLSLVTAVITAIATPLWVYAKDFFAEPLAAVGLIYFLYFALRGREGSRLASFNSGAALGLAPLAKPGLIVLALPCALFVVLNSWHLRHRRSQLGAFAVGFGLLLTLVALYNFRRFGTPFETGYGTEASQFTTPPLMGLIGLLASPGRGLLLYFPLWPLLIPDATRAREVERCVWVFSLGCTATLLALYCAWHQWEGGVCWGPRFLLPAIPVLMVALAPALPYMGSTRIGRSACLVLLASSGLIAFSGTVVNYFEYANWVQWQVRTDPALAAQGITSAYQLFLIRPEWSSLFANWTFGRWDYYFVLESVRRPGSVLVIYALFMLGLLGSVARLTALILAERSKHVAGPHRG